jgi:3-hydroxyisobutyrate dehydrogenase
MMRVGFIGLGSQGGPMARRIIDEGFATSLWARRSESLQSFAGSGADVVASPAELAAVSDLVCICVVDDAGVEEVMKGPTGVLSGLRPGSLIAIHSTVHPETCHRLAGRAASRGAALVDAPVSGGGQAAAEQRLLVMVGGGPEEYERALPVFSTFGSPVLHLGPLGSGQTAKALNNLLFTAHLGLATKLFDLARGLGFDQGTLAEALISGSGRSYGFELIARMDFGPAPLAEHVGALLRKDVGIVASLAAAAGVPADVLLQAAAVTLERMDAAPPN